MLHPKWRGTTIGSKYDSLLVNVRKLKGGEVFGALRGEDFHCEPVSFQGVIYQLAQKKGGGWKATTIVVRDLVFYAFYRESDYWKPNLPAAPIVKKWKGEI